LASWYNADVVNGGFELEQALVETLHDHSAEALNLGDRWWQIHREVTVRQRIADLILVHASSEPDSKPARVTYFEAAILSFLLGRGSTTVQVIADALYSSAPSIESRAARLARLGLVELSDHQVRATGRHLPGDVGIVAIEAKLTRWREAVEQASSYRVFANQSYIAMPRDVFARSGGICATCREAGVGALSVEARGAVSVVIVAPEITPHSPEWVRLLSSFVGVAHASNAFRHVD
jgi:hypothetical protein